MKTNEINIRDPFVLLENGTYYLYGTRGATCWGPATGFDVYTGTDLENWEGPFPCFENDGTFWADRNSGRRRYIPGRALTSCSRVSRAKPAAGEPLF